MNQEVKLRVVGDVSKAANMRQRRGLVYHEEIAVGNCKRKGHTKSDSDGGYGYGYPKKSRGSNSDEYKRRRYEEFNMIMKHSRYNQVFSPECYMISVIIVGLLLIAAYALLHYVISIPFAADVITRNRTYSYETSKSSFVVMSDSIDCSIYMKRITLQSMPIQHVMVHGLACLSINAPYSVAPDSGLSMLIYYRQYFHGLAKSKLEGYISESCSMFPESEDSVCRLRDYPFFIGSHIQLHKGNIMNSNLSRAWRDNSIDETHMNYKLWTRQIFENTSTHNYYRRFLISNLLNRTLADQSTNNGSFQQYWLKKMNISTINGDLKHLVVKPDLYTAKPLFSINATKGASKTTNNNFISLRLDRNDKEGAHLLLLLPKSDFTSGKTSSVFSAFVIQVVYSLMKNVKKSNPKFEVIMYDYILKAQQLAYGVFANSSEWKNNSTKASMLSDDTLQSIVKEWETGHPDLMRVSTQIRRTKPDRVATIINWRNNIRETITMLNMGLPTMFDSEHIHGKERSEFSVFYNNEQESTIFTSAAGLIVAYVNKLNHSLPLMVASASGSVRTVEAVSTVLLRMLLLNESPGKAITAPAAYWDVRDGKYYCESDTPRARELFRKMNFPAQCHDIPSDDFASNDRIAMAASKSRGRNQPIKASIDKRALDFNYAAGF